MNDVCLAMLKKKKTVQDQKTNSKRMSGVLVDRMGGRQGPNLCARGQIEGAPNSH